MTTGNGTVTVTSSTSNRIAGTFSFTLLPQAGSSATGQKVITNGVLDLTF